MSIKKPFASSVHHALVVTFLLVAAVAVLLATPATAEGDPSVELAPRAVAGVARIAVPPLPPTSTLPTQLVLDDNTAESSFGFAGGTARQFMWFNRFDSPGSFALSEIWVLFPPGADVPLGGAVQIAVFDDPDGDPTNGATLLATYDETIQANDGLTFSVYPLATPLALDATGAVLIGVVNRYFDTGVTPPPTLPAALDTTASEGSSYVALWPADASDPPDLASASTIQLVGGASAGNFMIRGFGGVAQVAPVPTLGSFGLLVLGLLTALVGSRRLRPR